MMRAENNFKRKREKKSNKSGMKTSSVLRENFHNSRTYQALK